MAKAPSTTKKKTARAKALPVTAKASPAKAAGAASVRANAKKQGKKTAKMAPAKVVEAELMDPESESGDETDVSPEFDGELPALDAIIDIDPDQEIVEDEIRALAQTPAKKKSAKANANAETGSDRGIEKSRTRRVKAELVDEENDQRTSRFDRQDSDSGNDSSDEGEASESKALTPANDPIAAYLAEIRRYPLLTKEQEQELAVKYRETGDARAAEQLVTSNLRFVVKVAAEYSKFGAKLIDLVQEGNVGLMHAVREFNPYRGVRLITYAVWWIRGYIQEYLMRQYSLVRIGTTQNQRKLFYRLQKERDALTSLGMPQTNALLAGRLGVSEEEVETMSKRLSGRDVSLSAPVDSSGESNTSLLDFEPSADVGVDDQIGHLEEIAVLNDNLKKIRAQLNEKETYILEKRILADEPMTLQEIGEHYGVTREAVRQLEARLINRIRTAVTHSLEHSSDDEDA